MERSFRAIFDWDHYFWTACWQLLGTQTHPTQGLVLSADVEVAHRGSAEGKDAHTGFPALIFKLISVCVYNTHNTSSLKPATAHPKDQKQFFTIFLIIPVVTMCPTSHALWYAPPCSHSGSTPSLAIKSVGAFSAASQADARNPNSASPCSGKAGRPGGHENSSLSPQRSACWVALSLCPPTLSLLRWALAQEEHASSKLLKAAELAEQWGLQKHCMGEVLIYTQVLNGSLCLRAPGAPPCLDLGSFWVGSLCCQIFAAEVGNQESE